MYESLRTAYGNTYGLQANDNGQLKTYRKKNDTVIRYFPVFTIPLARKPSYDWYGLGRPVITPKWVISPVSYCLDGVSYSGLS